MLRNETKSSLLVHVLGFTAVTICLIGFLLYQVIVDDGYHRISITKFIQKNVFSQVRKQSVTNPDVSFVYSVENNTLVLGLEANKRIVSLSTPIRSQKIFTSPRRDKVAFFTEDNSLHVVTIETGVDLVKHYPDEIAHIVHWLEDNETLVTAHKSSSWRLVLITPSDEKIIAENIHYPHTTLTAVYKPIHNKIIYPDCSQICVFNIQSLTSDSNPKVVPALMDGNPEGRLQDLEFAFYDEDKNLIGYQRNAGDAPDKFYVINDENTLLQAVYMKINQDKTFAYLGYFPEQQYIFFASQWSTKNLKELFLYAANRPSLRLLGRIPNQHSVELVDAQGLYTINGEVLKHAVSNTYSMKLPEKKAFVSNY